MVEFKIMWGWKFRVSAANIMYMYWDTSYACHTSKSGRALSAEKSVIVFPDPGGPQRTIGLCSASQV